MPRMKSILIPLALLSIAAPVASRAQDVVPAGAGSYASYPPLYETVLTDGVDVPVFYNFATTTNIMVRDGETRPLPSNDWWTSWLYSESDLLGGKIWAYPFAIDPANDGIQLYRPTRWNDSGTDMVTENLFRISGEDFSPTRSIVEGLVRLDCYRRLSGRCPQPAPYGRPRHAVCLARNEKPDASAALRFRGVL